MASQGPRPNAAVPRGPISRRCSRAALTRGQSRRKDRKEQPRRSGPAKTPAVAEGAGSCLARNVLKERERRRRISASCDRLRALLPHFNGRREDMASVLEMAVQFLRLAGTLAPGREQQTVLTPSKEAWHRWHKDVVQLALARQTLAGPPDLGVGASTATTQQAPLSCASTGVHEGEAPTGVAEVLDRPAALPGPCSLAPRTPGPSPSKDPRLPSPWALRSQPPPCLLGSEAAAPLSEGTDQEGADGPATPDARSVLGCDVEDGVSFLLSASPDWWLDGRRAAEGGSWAEAAPPGPWPPACSAHVSRLPPGSLEGRGGNALTRAPARSSFLADPEPGPQELPDGALEPWGADMGCPSLGLRDEVDSIFPDFLACEAPGLPSWAWGAPGPDRARPAGP